MMPAGELVGAWALALATLAVASIFGVRQLNVLVTGSTSDEGKMLRRSAGRRFVVSGLLIACSALVAWPYITNIAADVARIAPDHDRLTPDELAVARAYAWCWVAIAALLFVALAIIAYDLWIVRRYWAGRLERLHGDRRDMIERQLARHRHEQNGYHVDE